MMREDRENNGKSRRSVKSRVGNCMNCTNKIKNKKTIDNSCRRISYLSMMREDRENNGKSRRSVKSRVGNCMNCTNKIKNKKTIDNSCRRMV